MAIFLAFLQFVIGVVKQGALQMLITKIEQGKQCRVCLGIPIAGVEERMPRAVTPFFQRFRRLQY